MKNDGYTLIEMVLVIVIIGILASVAVQSLNKTENNRRLDETMAEMEEIARAIAGDERLISDGVRTDFGYVGDIGSLPSNLDDLAVNPGGYATWKGPYIRNNVNENSEEYKRDCDLLGIAFIDMGENFDESVAAVVEYLVTGEARPQPRTSE